VKGTRAHLLLALAWLLLLPPTILWWRESVPYLIFMSWYANFVGHLAAWQSAHAEESIKGDK
jgi:hypothetical protein